MIEIDLRHVENRLLEERKRTLDDLQQAEEEGSEGQSESAGELSRVPFHQADVGSDTHEAEEDWANVNRGSEQLTRIDDALRLLRRDPEAFATCERCGATITAERLEIVPWTRLCAACARRAQGVGRET